MKKSTFIVGVISSLLILIGVIFKIQHWAGAGVAITLGAVFIAICYSILLLIDKNAIAQNGYQKFVNYMSMLTLLILTLAFLFKAMHWPGAGIGIWVGHIMMLIMIPVLFIQASRETDPVKKLNFNNIAILFMAVTAVCFYILWQFTKV